MSAPNAEFPVVGGIRYNLAKSSGQPQVTHESLLQQFIEVEYLPLAKQAGLTVRVKEDGFRDPVDANVHLRLAGTQDQTWHLYWASWLSRTCAGAADLNVDPGSKERAWHLKVIVPRLELWGIGYHVESDHLHIDVGTFTSNVPGDGGWRRRALGTPNWGKTHVIPVTGRFDLDGGGYDPATTKALQHFLNHQRHEALAEDGDLGGFTARALQRWAGTKQDGSIGPITRAAVGKRIGSKLALGDTWVNTLLQIRLNSANTGCTWQPLPA